MTKQGRFGPEQKRSCIFFWCFWPSGLSASRRSRTLTLMIALMLIPGPAQGRSLGLGGSGTKLVSPFTPPPQPRKALGLGPKPTFYELALSPLKSPPSPCPFFSQGPQPHACSRTWVWRRSRSPRSPPPPATVRYEWPQQQSGSEPGFFVCGLRVEVSCATLGSWGVRVRGGRVCKG